MLSLEDLHEPKNVLGLNKKHFTIDNLKKFMSLEYKAKEKQNKREGMLSRGIILKRSAQMKKSVKNP